MTLLTLYDTMDGPRTDPVPKCHIVSRVSWPLLSVLTLRTLNRLANDVQPLR